VKATRATAAVTAKRIGSAFHRSRRLAGSGAAPQYGSHSLSIMPSYAGQNIEPDDSSTIMRRQHLRFWCLSAINGKVCALMPDKLVRSHVDEGRICSACPSRDNELNFDERSAPRLERQVAASRFDIHKSGFWFEARSRHHCTYSSLSALLARSSSSAFPDCDAPSL